MKTINENNLSISEFQDQVVELDDNELDNIAGGLVGAAAGAFVAGEIARRDGKSPKREYEDAFIGAIGGLATGSFAGPLGAALSTPKA
jgi:hypothetical protein